MTGHGEGKCFVQEDVVAPMQSSPRPAATAWYPLILRWTNPCTVRGLAKLFLAEKKVLLLTALKTM